MDTVRLLNSYRKAITRDRDAIHILAFLHRDGPQDEGALAAKLEATVDVSVKLTELYRANFVVLSRVGLYSTSELAEQILTELGIADIVARQTLEAADIPPDDRSFLQSCLRQSEDGPLGTRRYIRTALRTAAQLLTSATPPDVALRLATWYAVIAGLDPATHELGAEVYSRHIANRSTEPDLLGESKLHYFELQCKSAVKLRKASNQFLSGSSPSADASDAVLALTFVRLFSSTVTRTIDDGLCTSINTTGVDTSAIEHLTKWVIPRRDHIDTLPWGGFRREVDKASDVVQFLLTHVPLQPWPAWSHVAATTNREAISSLDNKPLGLVSSLRVAEEIAHVQRIDQAEAIEALPLLERIRSYVIQAIEQQKRTPRTKEHHAKVEEWQVQVLEPSSLRKGRPIRIIKSKNVAIRPMSIEEAALRLDDSKNEFIVFRNADTDSISIIRRRDDESFDVLAPA